MYDHNDANNRHAVIFDPILVVYVLMVVLMAGAVAYSVSLYLGWIVALPIGTALTYCFSRLVKTVVAPAGMFSKAWRLGCGLAALAVFGVTMGLSYSTLYAKFFAQSSALDFFQKTRLPVQRQLETLVGNARTASKALAAWDEHSRVKADQESTAGGTCPSKAASASGRGPIAMFRLGERGIASNLHADIESAVEAMAAGLNHVKQVKPTNFAEAAKLTNDLNVVIETGEVLVHGALIKSAKQTLQSRMDSQIAWPNGEVFSCGDTTRDELLKRALAALTAVEQLPALKPMAPGIDLSNPQAVANRGLLRSFNSVALLASFGLVGQYEDDPLMVEALKKGVINQETLGMFTASLLELCVVLTAVMASRRGTSPFAFKPDQALAAWHAKAEAENRFGMKTLHLLGLALCKAVFNMLWAYPATNGTTTLIDRPSRNSGFTIDADPVYPGRELSWATSLAPYLISFHDDDYVCIPAGRSPKASMAARALRYQGAATLINSLVPWEAVAGNRVAAHQLQKLVPDAKGLSWEVFKLEPSFAQALRLMLLGGERA